MFEWPPCSRQSIALCHLWALRCDRFPPRHEEENICDHQLFSWKHTVYQPRGRYLIYSASNTCIIYYTLIIYYNVSSAIQICTVALHPREIWIHLCTCTPSKKVWLKIMTSRLALSTQVHVWMKYDLGQPACTCMYQKVPHQVHRFDEIKLAGSQISSLIKARTSSTFRALGGPVWQRESVLKIQ